MNADDPTEQELAEADRLLNRADALLRRHQPASQPDAGRPWHEPPSDAGLTTVDLGEEDDDDLPILTEVIDRNDPLLQRLARPADLTPSRREADVSSLQPDDAVDIGPETSKPGTEADDGQARRMAGLDPDIRSEDDEDSARGHHDSPQPTRNAGDTPDPSAADIVATDELPAGDQNTVPHEQPDTITDAADDIAGNDHFPDSPTGADAAERLIPAGAPTRAPSTTADTAPTTVDPTTLAEHLVALDSELQKEIERWFRDELPGLVSAEFERFSERLQARALDQLRSHLLPLLSERIGTHLESIDD